jgi:hypothetical protein
LPTLSRLLATRHGALEGTSTPELVQRYWAASQRNLPGLVLGQCGDWANFSTLELAEWLLGLPPMASRGLTGIPVRELSILEFLAGFQHPLFSRFLALCYDAADAAFARVEHASACVLTAWLTGQFDARSNIGAAGSTSHKLDMLFAEGFDAQSYAFLNSKTIQAAVVHLFVTDTRAADVLSRLTPSLGSTPPSAPLLSEMGSSFADSCVTYQLHLLGAYIFFGDLIPTLDSCSDSFLVRQLCRDLALSCYYACLGAGSDSPLPSLPTLEPLWQFWLSACKTPDFLAPQGLAESLRLYLNQDLVVTAVLGWCYGQYSAQPAMPGLVAGSAAAQRGPARLTLFNDNVHFLDVDFLLNLDWQYFFNAIFDDKAADALRNPLLMLTRPSSVAPMMQQLTASSEAVFGPTTGMGAPHAIRLFLSQYYSALCSLDYVNDWRALKLERET